METIKRSKYEAHIIWCVHTSIETTHADMFIGLTFEASIGNGIIHICGGIGKHPF